MSEKPPVPYEEVQYHLYEDELQKARTLSDAELLQNGAEYRRGVLTPTEQQVAEIKRRQEKQYTEFAMADAADEARKIIEGSRKTEYTQYANPETNNNTGDEKLRTDILSVTQPYTDMFAAEIPVKNPDDPPKLGKQRKREWEVQTNRGGIRAVTMFELKYTPEQDGDRLDEIDMRFNDAATLATYKKNYISPGFKFSYEAGKLSKITTLDTSAGMTGMYLRVNRGDNMFDAQGDKSPLVERPKKLNLTPMEKFAKFAGNNVQYLGEMVIDLNPDRPSIRFDMGWYRNRGVRKQFESGESDPGIAIEYTFNAETDQFVATTVNEKIKDSENLPALSKEDFLDLIKAPLQLVPLTY